MRVLQSCQTLCDPVDCSLPGSSVHGILQARILEWNAISFSEVFIYLYHKDGTKSGLTIYQVAILFFLSSGATEWFSKNTETNKNFQITFIFGGYWNHEQLKFITKYLQTALNIFCFLKHIHKRKIKGST